MDGPTRSLLGSEPPDEPASEPQAELSGQSVEPNDAGPGSPRGAAPDAASSEQSPSHNAKFVGEAMRSLYRASSASVERGDATRVITREQERASTRPGPSTPPPSMSSRPAGPRVDVTLWIVLALGLFAIAGVMLSAAL